MLYHENQFVVVKLKKEPYIYPRTQGKTTTLIATKRTLTIKNVTNLISDT